MTILTAVALAYGINEKEIYKPTHSRRISEPRMVAITIMVASGESRCSDLPNVFPVKKSAISHAITTVRSLTRYDANFRKRLIKILTHKYESKQRRRKIIEKILTGNQR